MPNEKVSYSGQKVFIGIDVHKVSYSVACICDGELVRRCTMEARPEALLRYMVQFFRDAEIFSVYEAGFSGFTLHRYLDWLPKAPLFEELFA